MSKLSVLMAEPEKVKLKKGEEEVEIEIHSLGLDEMDCFMLTLDVPLNERAKKIARMIDETLKLADPEATEEERKQIGLRFSDQLIPVIMRVNNIKGDKSPHELIKAQQAAAAATKASGK